PYTEDQVLRGGMRIYTTLDPSAQRLAYDAVYGAEGLNRNADPAGALVSLDDEGRVVAMVGGKDWAASKVNLAVGTDGGGSGRQAGSTFKPIVLAEAMRQGISLDAPFAPGPAKIVLPKADRGADWEVNNFENASYGRISLLNATANSVNTVYAQLVVQVGPAKVVEMAQKLGVRAELNPDASIALGTADVSVLDMASAYLTLQGKGMHVEPRVIRRITQNDSVLVDDRPKATRVLERDVAEKVNYALQQVIEAGSGTAAALPQAQVWGKTGTTDLYGDAWFVGYTRHLTTAVWMGYPEGQSKPLYDVHGVRKVNGGSLPAQMFKRYMTKASPADATPPDKIPDLSGRSPSPVPSVTSSGSGTSNGSSSSPGSGSSSGSGSGSGSGSSSATTIAEDEETPPTTARSRTATTLAEPVRVPTTPAPAFAPPTVPATTTPRPRPTINFPTTVAR
ncbi:MAG: transglycosylase domain-containing protein, partial [Acidimicrobiales bacterium]